MFPPQGFHRAGAPAPMVQTRRMGRTEYALILSVTLFVLAVTALVVSLVTFTHEIHSAQCFRSNQKAIASIAAEDRRVTDRLMAGFAHTLAHPSRHETRDLLGDLDRYQAARARDDRLRLAHPLDDTC